ncbi:MAG: hypothetical protein U0136_08930 [Bdellovibrionota bacterium]
MTQTFTEADLVRGFLPKDDPLRQLPSEFAALEEMARELPKILVAASPRKLLAQLGPVPIEKLKTRAEEERAMLLLSFIGHGYVWGEKAAAPSIPASLALPWHALAKRLDRTPSLVYCSYALHNWRRLVPSEDVKLGNIALLQNFLAGIDEEWFVVIHVDIEALAAPAIRSLLPLQRAAQSGDTVQLRELLERVAGCLERMNASMDRMPENCDPYIYYNRVRPFIHGWKNNPALPQGLIYEGVTEYGGKPQQFRGETGSQSSIVPCLDAALGIVHKEDQLAVYLREMRDYMPKEHRAFLHELEKAPRTRELISAKYLQEPGVKDAFNACVQGINRFRTTHLQYAASYIDKQTQVDPTNPNKVGTGGTPFMVYLGKHQRETAEHLL